MHFIYIKKPQNTCKCQQRKCFNFFSFQFFFGGEGVLLPLNNGGEIWYTIKIYFHSHFCCAVSLMLKHKTFTGYSKPVRIQWTTRNLIDKYMYRLNWTFFFYPNRCNIIFVKEKKPVIKMIICLLLSLLGTLFITGSSIVCW